jgi:hypothetical protein
LSREEQRILAIDVYKDWLGIPEGPRPPDHYQLLRLVQFEEAVEKIRGNYKKLNAHVKKYATGQYADQSQALLNELAKAMLCLTDLERKREYDESQGRTFEEEAKGPATMDQILLEQKHVSPEQAKEAREHAERTGLDLRDSFVQLKMVPPEIAAQALAQELGLPYVDLADMLPDDDVLDQVPKSTVKQHSILPLFIDQGVLLVACVHQIEHELEDELRLRFNVPIRPVLAAPLAINQGIAKFYAPGARDERAAQAAEKEPGKKDTGKTKKAEPAAKAKPKPRRGPRTPEEMAERRKLGIVIINFSFLLAYLLDWFVITPGVFGFNTETFMLFVGVPGITALFVWQILWKN